MPNILARFVEDISNEEFLGNFYEKKTAIDKSNRCYNYKSDKKGGKFYVKWKSYHNSF